MTITSHQRGHEIEYIPEEKRWIYSDTKTPADDSRPCIKCGRRPTKEGYDACLGHLKGVTSACCGHGIDEKIIVKEEEAVKENDRL